VTVNGNCMFRTPAAIETARIARRTRANNGWNGNWGSKSQPIILWSHLPSPKSFDLWHGNTRERYSVTIQHNKA